MNPFERPASAGPPADVPAGELLRKLMDSALPSEVIPWPRDGEDGKPIGQVAIRILTQDELDKCAANAERYVRNLLNSGIKDKSQGSERVNQAAWAELFETAKAVELLYIACRKHDDLGTPLFRTPADIREFATPNEITHVLNAYMQLQFRFGPLWRLLTEEECDEWIRMLEAGADEYPLAQLSPGQLRLLVTSLVSRYGSLAMGKFSDGSQSSVGTSESSQQTASE